MTRNIGYVGLDHHHRDPYLETIEQLDANVIATADPSGTQPVDVGANSVMDVPWYNVVEDMVAEHDIDLLWVTLSNRETPSVINTAIDANVDVLSEKPGARTAADLQPVTDRLEETDVTVGFSYAWRGHPIARDLRDRVADGFFGSIRSFALKFVASSLKERPTDHFLYDAADSRGGIVQWLGVHWLDLISWILDDDIVRVNASTRAGTEGIDVEDGATLQLELASGAVGSLLTGYYLRGGRYDTTFDIYGSRSDCSWDPIGSTFGFDGETSVEFGSDEWVSTPHRKVVHEYEPAAGYGGRWGRTFYEEFLAACDGNIDVPAGVEDALQVLRVLDAIYESAESERWVTIK